MTKDRIVVEENNGGWNNEALLKYAEKANWNVNLSSVVGYFPDNLPGYRCLWTCRWVTDKEVITFADMGMVLDIMPLEYIKAEIEDLAYRGDRYANELCDRLFGYEYFSKGKETEWYRKGKESLEIWFETRKETIFTFLTKRRAAYPKFLPVWEHQLGKIDIPLSPGFSLRGMLDE